jgi:hypothetical protein
MKTLEVIEKSDLQSIEEKLYYFFGSDDGWLKRNEITTYVHWIKPEQEAYITELINNSNKDELKRLKDHICKRLDYKRKELIKHKEAVNNIELEIENQKKYLESVSNKDTFRDAILSLLP